MSFINNNKYFHDSINEELSKKGFIELQDINNKDKIFFCDVSYPDRNNPSYMKCQIVNQLKDVNPLGNKKDQYNNHLKYYKKRPDYLPFTLAFNRNTMDEIATLFKGNPRDSPQVYIVKPENDSFRNGVGIVRNKLELMAHMDNFYMYDDWIIQDYIDDPLLIHNRKFHMRIYVIYIQTKDYQCAYLSDVGFIYTSNKDFTKETFENDVVLSGESTPKNVYYIPDDFYRNFSKKTYDEVVKPQIVKITRETLMATLDLLKCPQEEQKCFKIMGYDILINNEYKCFLAEINVRGVTYKYPNKKFLDSFYRNILKLILPESPPSNKELSEKNVPFERILYNRNGVISENFSNNNLGMFRFSEDQLSSKRIKKFNDYYMKLVFPFLVFILILLVVHVHLKG